MPEDTGVPYAAMLGGDGSMPPPPAATPFLGMTQPQPDVSTIQRPAASPEELQQRQLGWQALLNNPNFMRAVGVMGAHLAQPRQLGQTRMGQLGQGFMAGQSAFQMGDYAQYEQDMAAKKEARAQAESTANVAHTQSGTALNTARTPGVQADSDVAVETKDSRIAASKLTQDLAKFNFDKAQSVEEVDKMRRELDKRKLTIEKDIPDAALRSAALAKVEAAGLQAEEARARLAASKAAAGASDAAAKASGVRSAHDQITVDVLNAMPAEEKKQFLTKTGPYSNHVSSAGAAAQMYGSMYDGLIKTAPNDPRVKGKTREQFQMEGITSQKNLDSTTALKNYIIAMATANLDPDADVIQGFSDAIRSSIAAKNGKPGGAPAAGGNPKAPAVDAAGYAKLKKGDQYTDPQGQVRTKQ